MRRTLNVVVTKQEGLDAILRLMSKGLLDSVYLEKSNIPKDTWCSCGSGEPHIPVINADDDPKYQKFYCDGDEQTVAKDVGVTGTTSTIEDHKNESKKGLLPESLSEDRIPEPPKPDETLPDFQLLGRIYSV